MSAAEEATCRGGDQVAGVVARRTLDQEGSACGHPGRGIGLELASLAAPNLGQGEECRNECKCLDDSYHARFPELESQKARLYGVEVEQACQLEECLTSNARFTSA